MRHSPPIQASDVVLGGSEQSVAGRGIYVFPHLFLKKDIGISCWNIVQILHIHWQVTNWVHIHCF